MTEERVLRIQATDVDTNGVWHWEGKEIPLLGRDTPSLRTSAGDGP